MTALVSRESAVSSSGDASVGLEGSVSTREKEKITYDFFLIS